MSHRFDPSHRHGLDSPERRRILPPETVLGAFNLATGETLVDVWAGVGLFAFPAAAIAGPGGRVIALDVAPEMVEELARKGEAAGLANFEARRSEEYSFGIGPNTADLLLLATVLHEVDDKPRFLAECRRALKAGGRIGIVEWQARETGRGPSLSERLASSAVLGLLGSAGFVAPSVQDLNEYFYLASATVAEG